MKYRIEEHCHTKDSSPCGQVCAEDILKAYQENNYSGIIITDHFSYQVFGNNDSWKNIVDKFLLGYKNANKSN